MIGIEFQSILEHRPGLKVKLDWRAYYREFETLHGGDPVMHKGRLLFRDGWTYSSSDYKGPEWPPPKDPAHLEQLHTAYWTIRKQILVEEARDLSIKHDGLVSVQENRSAPLQQTVRVFNDETGRYAYEQLAVNLRDIQDRLEWVLEQIRECDRELSHSMENSNASSPS